jgi:hypothetical protein
LFLFKNEVLGLILKVSPLEYGVLPPTIKDFKTQRSKEFKNSIALVQKCN